MNQTYEKIMEELSQLDGFIEESNEELFSDSVKHNDLLRQLNESQFLRQGHYCERKEMSLKTNLEKEIQKKVILEKKALCDLDKKRQGMKNIDDLINMI